MGGGDAREVAEPADLHELRRALMDRGLDEGDLAPDPIEQFSGWYDLAERSGVYQPDAMTLATVDPDGVPAARVVLLRGVDPRGFRFFTDRASAKGRELAAHPRAALVIVWPVLARQVRVVGQVSPTDDAESDEYWRTRPRGSQIAAVASRQSTPLDSRRDLLDAMDAVDREHADGAVPRPERWGGSMVRPVRVEFWQGREHRAHDRLRYERAPGADGTGDDDWRVVRLSP